VLGAEARMSSQTIANVARLVQMLAPGVPAIGELGRGR